MTSWRASRRAGGFTGRGRSVLCPALMGAGNAHIFAIFRHRAARDVNAGVIELFRDLIVSERLCAVFFFYHFLDMPLPSGPCTDSLKKERNSSTPCDVCAYLLATARLTVDGCTPTSSATSLIIMGLRASGPWVRKSPCR